MNKEAILDISIEPNGEAVNFKTENGEIVMIPFKGTVTGPLFTGIVEPCGVDRHVVNAVNVRHMSARYTLTGKDSEGNDAHIYVENNGWFDALNMPDPFRTVPTFYTDSPVLAPYLHCNQFYGEGVGGEDGLHIYFYQIKKEAE